MNEMDFFFEETPAWQWLQQLKPGSVVPAGQLLMLWEDAPEDWLEELFRQLEEKDILLDVTELAVTAPAGDTAKRLQLEQLAKQDLKQLPLEPTDPLRLYLEELSQLPACGDIVCLAEQLGERSRAGKDAQELRTRIADLSLSRVVELAAMYTGYGVLLLDLIQEGSMGLWRATEDFTGVGAEFENYRDLRIRFHLAKAVFLQAYESGVGQKLRAAAEDYRSVDERLLAELGRNPTLEELAQGLHMSVAQTAVVAKTVENVRMLGKTVKPESQELPQEEDQAVENTAYFQMRQRIAELLSALPESEAQLLTLRYGLEGGAPADVQQTAARLGITVDEVVAREAAALSKLRQGS